MLVGISGRASSKSVGCAVWGRAKKEQKAASSSGGTGVTVVKELTRDR